MAVKVLGYGEKLLLAYYWGTGLEVDVYTLVTTIILALFFFFREIVEPAFLPVFIKTKEESGEKDRWNLFKLVFAFILLITVLLTVLILMFPQYTLHLFAPGFKKEGMLEASQIIKIAGPACVFLCLSTLTYITLNAYKIFAVAALGDLLQKAGILLTIVLLYPKTGIYSAAFGILIGALLRFLAHMPIILHKMSWDLRFKFAKGPAKEVWVLTMPLLLGVGFSQINSIADNVFASYLSEGSISALSFSRKLVELPIILLPYAVSVVLFPYLSQYVTEEKIKQLQNTITIALQWIAIVFIPISVYYIVMAQHLVELVFQRGAFDANSTLITTIPLKAYSIGMLFFALETVVVIIYFSFSDTKTPIFTGIICAVLNLIITFILVKPLGSQGIALSLVISKTIKVITLLYLLKRKVELNAAKLGPWLLKLLPGVLVFSVSIVLFHCLIKQLGELTPIYKFSLLLLGFALPGSLYLFISNKTLNLLSLLFNKI